MTEEQPRQMPPFHERDDTIPVSDNNDIITKFALEPNLTHYSGSDKLSHINKNILFGNLRRQEKEPEKVVAQLKNITILKRFVQTRKVHVPTGQYEKVGEDKDKVIMREIFVEETVTEYRWPNLIDYYSTKVYGITSTSAGTDLKLVEALKSIFIHKEQSIEDKTQTTQSWAANFKKKR